MAAYRPFFLLAALAAIAGGLIWWAPLPAGRQIVVHLHLLLFGMGGAAVAGYLLTALPNWAGRAPVPPWLIRSLVALWLLDRIPPFLAASPPQTIMYAAGPAFFLLLAAFLIRRVAAAAAWSRLHLAAAPILLAAAEVIILRQWFFDAPPTTTGLWAVLVFALLIVLVGGRAVPAFTDTALRLHALPGRVWTPASLQAASVGVLLAALASLLLSEWTYVTGGLVLAAGALQLVRLAGWQPLRGLRLGPVAMLQLAWGWLAVGLMLLGLALWWPQVLHIGTALHALTMGAMGGMIVAIALRSAMPRDQQGLWASGVQLSAAVLVLLSPVPRLLVAGPWPFDGLAWAVACWTAGWLLFLPALWPALRGPVPHPVLSGPRPRE